MGPVKVAKTSSNIGPIYPRLDLERLQEPHTGWRSPDCWQPSRLEHSADIAAAGGFFRESKGSLFAHFPRSAQQRAEGGASQTTAQADGPDADRREICHVQRSPRDPHENIHRAIHRANECSDFVLAGDAWRVENISAR